MRGGVGRSDSQHSNPQSPRSAMLQLFWAAAAGVCLPLRSRYQTQAIVVKVIFAKPLRCRGRKAWSDLAPCVRRAVCGRRPGASERRRRKSALFREPWRSQRLGVKTFCLGSKSTLSSRRARRRRKAAAGDAIFHHRNLPVRDSQAEKNKERSKMRARRPAVLCP